MKKLLILSILILGIVYSSDAQSLTYGVKNASDGTPSGLPAATWEFEFHDAGNPVGTYLVIPPISVVTGTNASFAFKLKWFAKSTNGCKAKGLISTVTSPAGVNFNDSCGNTHKYKVVKDNNGNFSMKWLFTDL